MDDRNEDRPARLALPGRPEDGRRIGPVGLDQRGHGLGSDPGHPGRPEQRRARLADRRPGELDAADHLADRTGLRRGGGAVDGLGPDQRRGHGAGGSGDRTTIGNAPPDQAMSTSRRTRGWPIVVGQGALLGRGQDDGGDGHGRMLAGRVRPGGHRGVGGHGVPHCDGPMTTLTSPTVPSAPSSAVRDDLRNIAIVAHVDHGKTTLVDAMLRQTGAFRANQALVDRVLDSMDLEREKGITILAKQTTVDYGGVRLNIVDTPGHADFGGEVERSLLMVDSVLLLVDAAEGPLPADPLRPPEGDGPPPAGRRRAQQDRPRRRPPGRGPRRRLRAVHGPRRRRAPDRVPGRLHERQGGHGDDRPGAARGRTSGRSSTSSSGSRRRRPIEPDHPLQLLVTNLSANEYVGRMAVGRIRNGRIRMGGRISVVREEADDTAGRGRARPDGDPQRDGDQPPDRPRDRAGRHRRGRTGRHRVGRRAARGDDRRHPDRPGRPAPAAAPRRRRPDPADDLRGEHRRRCPAATGGTSRRARSRPASSARCWATSSIEVHPTEAGDTYEVRGRGELQLAVLIEQMRREGFELDGQPPGGHPARGRRRRSRSPTSGSRSTSRPTTSARSRPRWPDGRPASSR